MALVIIMYVFILDNTIKNILNSIALRLKIFIQCFS